MISMIALEKTKPRFTKCVFGSSWHQLVDPGRRKGPRGVAIVHLSSAQLYRDHSKPL